ncbi:MAG: hypothetical protein Q8P72_01675 [Candidatus Roizmanbacteria bacterium]|nr:hypothetical protein [Candidatus Roizmanbacteria bacterium]
MSTIEQGIVISLSESGDIIAVPKKFITSSQKGVISPAEGPVLLEWDENPASAIHPLDRNLEFPEPSGRNVKSVERSI